MACNPVPEETVSWWQPSQHENNWHNLLLLREDVTFSLLGPALVGAAEVGIIDVGGDLNLGNIQLCTCGNDKVLMDTADRHTVHLVWPWSKNN